MTRPTREEEALLAETPKGTYAVMLVVAALLFAGWLYFYFGDFLRHGPVR
jgi:hypothetical protein